MLTNIVNTTPNFTLLIITDPTKEHIPHNNHQGKANLKLNLIVALLRNTYQPTGMIDQDFKQLICFAQDFFLKGNVLWHKSIHGHHKVVIPLTYSSLPGDAQLVGGWCQRLSSILFRGIFNL
jgi:hypothetical protein